MLVNLPIPAHLLNSDCDPVTVISQTTQHSSVPCGAIGLYLSLGSLRNSLCLRQGVRGIDCFEKWMGKTGRKERQTVKGGLVTAVGLWRLIPLGHFREPVWIEHILQRYPTWRVRKLRYFYTKPHLFLLRIAFCHFLPAPWLGKAGFGGCRKLEIRPKCIEAERSWKYGKGRVANAAVCDGTKMVKTNMGWKW